MRSNLAIETMPCSDDFEQQLTDVLDRLYAAALRMTKNRSDAEDLVSDAVTKALKNKDKLKDPASFRGWMFRILTNTFISHCRKKKNRPEISLAETDNENEEEFWLFDRLHQPLLLFWGSNPEQEFLNNVLREDLARALDKLKDEYRMVVLLSDVEGFSYPEIAAILDIPVGTVRSRLARARSRLQKSLWQQAIDTGFVKDPADRLRSETP
ncbi:MAG: sigma-70 family RNA polymerase sigma factor [Gammaproteobacteria bacterium]|nr:sigma-70 family RNA polymerase sigma factor [Gammaproteobacteria bacterium]